MPGMSLGLGLGLSRPLRAAAGEAAPLVVRSVSRGEPSSTTQAAAGAGKTRFDSRIWCPFPYPLTRFKFVFSNKVLTTSTEVNGPGAITYNLVAAEVGGVAVPAPFSGGRSLVQAAGTLLSATEWIASPDPSALGAWCRLQADAASGFPATRTTLTGDRTISYDPANAGNTIDAVGAFTTPTGGINVLHLAPIMVLGEISADKMVLFAIGDSIGSDEDDFTTTNSWTGETGGGMFRRTGYALGIPVTNASVSGRTLAAYSSSGLLQAMMQYHTDLVIEAGTNDLAVGTSAANLLIKAKSIWADATAAGVSRIWHTTLLPRCTTTDRTTTLANQTPVAGFELGGRRDTYKASLLANVGADGLTGVIEIAAIAEEPTARDKWALRSFATTLTAAATSSATSISVAHAAPANEYLVADPGGANQSTQKSRVSVGGLTPTLTSGGFGVAQLNGAVVKASPSRDATHPSPILHIAFKDLIVATLSPYVL